MRLTAVVACLGRTGRLFSPLENRQLRVVAMNNDPPHRTIALYPADFAPINRSDHCLALAENSN